MKIQKELLFEQLDQIKEWIEEDKYVLAHSESKILTNRLKQAKEEEQDHIYGFGVEVYCVYCKDFLGLADGETYPYKMVCESCYNKEAAKIEKKVE